MLVPAVFLALHSLVGGYAWRILAFVYFVLTFGSGIILFVSQLRTTERTRKKKQVRVLVIASSVSFLLYSTLVISGTCILNIPAEQFSSIFFLPWAFGYLLAIKGYQLLHITPEMVTRRILESIDELVIMVTPEGKVAYMNKRAVLFFGKAFKTVEELRLVSLSGQEDTKRFLSPIPCEYEVVKTRVLFQATSGKDVLRTLDMNISRVIDTFGDPMGFLLVGTELEMPNTLRSHFLLTDREIDVVYCLLNGWKTALIADHLQIGERTVKSHISSVYRKLGVNNRIDVIKIVLGDYT